MVDKLQINIYTDELSEYQNGLQGGQIDLTDWTVPATLSNSIAATGSGFYLTAPNSEFGIYDIDFNHANTFFGIPFSFGRDGATGSQCPSRDCTRAAVNFRQGLSHLIDKAAFITAAPTIAGKANVLDSPLPPGQGVLHSGLPTNSQNPPSPATCFVSTNVTCATGTATGPYTTNAMNANGTSTSVTAVGVCGWDLLNLAHLGMNQKCQSAYKYGTDSSTNGIVDAKTTNPDFCDAATHWQAAGLGAGVSTVDCHLLGFAPLAGGASTITFVVRSDSPPLLLLGDNLAARMCELIHGAGTTSCNEITVSHQTMVQVVSTVFSTKTVLTDWHMYTADWRLSSQFDQVFSLYNSAFSSSGCNPAQHAVASGQDYPYFCNGAYDTATNNMEFASSYSVAVQQAQVAMNVSGSHVATIPIWSGAIQFGYAKGWTGVNDATGYGPPNFFTLLNMWNPAPALPGTARWGFRQGTANLNPFLANTRYEQRVESLVYDTLLQTDPYNPSTVFGWMVDAFTLPSPTDIKMILKPNMVFHDGTNVTASDVKFSLLSFQQAGGSMAGAVADVNDVNLITSSLFDITLLHPSPFALFNIGSVPIVPQHVWALDKVTPCTVKGSNACTLDTSLLTGTAADPVINHTFIGSGPFQCVDLVTGQIGGGCTQTATGGPGTQSVGVNGKIILQRTGFGFAGTDPRHSYFRDSAKYLQWQWADRDGDGTVDALHDVGSATFCNTQFSSDVCAYWDFAIANPSCSVSAGSCNTGSLGPIGGNHDCQVSAIEAGVVTRQYGLSWTYGVDYSSLTGAQPAPQILYEGGVVYNPTFWDLGCANPGTMTIGALNTTITVSALPGFYGTVSLSLTITQPALSVILNATIVTLTPGATNNVILNVTSTPPTPGRFIVTLIASSGSLVRSATAIVEIDNSGGINGRAVTI